MPVLGGAGPGATSLPELPEKGVAGAAVVEAAETGKVGRLPQAVGDAAEHGDEAALLAWLDSGGQVNATHRVGDVHGITALMHAAHQGHERVVDLLLQHGAEINLQDGNGTTALIAAA